MIRKYQFWAKGLADGIKTSFTGYYSNNFELEKDAFFGAAEETLKLIKDICPSFELEQQVEYNEKGCKATCFPTLKQLTKEPNVAKI